jgi:hypothetical protein
MTRWLLIWQAGFLRCETAESSDPELSGKTLSKYRKDHISRQKKLTQTLSKSLRAKKRGLRGRNRNKNAAAANDFHMLCGLRFFRLNIRRHRTIFYMFFKQLLPNCLLVIDTEKPKLCVSGLNYLKILIAFSSLPILLFQVL